MDQRAPRGAHGVPRLPTRGRRPHDGRLERPDIRVGRKLLRPGSDNLVPRLDAARACPWPRSVFHEPDRCARRREPHVEHPDDAARAPRLAAGEDRRPNLRIQRPHDRRHRPQRLHRVARDPPLDRRRCRRDGRRRGLRLLALRRLPCGAAPEPRHGLGPAAVPARPRRTPGDPASTAVASGGGVGSPEHRPAPDHRGDARHERRGSRSTRLRHGLRASRRAGRGAVSRRSGPARARARGRHADVPRARGRAAGRPVLRSAADQRPGPGSQDLLDRPAEPRPSDALPAGRPRRGDAGVPRIQRHVSRGDGLPRPAAPGPPRRGGHSPVGRPADPHRERYRGATARALARAVAARRQAMHSTSRFRGCSSGSCRSSNMYCRAVLRSSSGWRSR